MCPEHECILSDMYAATKLTFLRHILRLKFLKYILHYTYFKESNWFLQNWLLVCQHFVPKCSYC